MRCNAECVCDETSGIGPGPSRRRDRVGTRCGTSHNRLAVNLLAQDFFCIDKLQHEGEAFFQAEPYTLSQGDAKFIVQKLQKAVQ